MDGGLLRRAGLLVIVCALSACSLRAPPAERVVSAPVELVATPFFEQRVHHCGPAALASLLVGSGVASATPDALSPSLFLPEREGTVRTELLAVSRAHGRIPLTVDGGLDGIVEALRDGYPVLVLQNLGIEWIPRWHYAVVVAVEPERGTIVLRSGYDPRRRMALDTFMNTWARSDHWAMVVSRPDRIPSFANELAWLRAAAPAESAGQARLALTAFEAASERWPASGLVHAALGNAHHALGDTAAARRHWREALQHDPALATAQANLAATAPD